MMKLWGNKDSGPYSVSADCLPLTLQSFMSSSRLSIVTSTNICITFSTFSCIVLSCLSKQFCQISNITLSCRKLWTLNITFCLRVMKVTEERTCVISSWQVLSENWQLLEAWEALDTLGSEPGRRGAEWVSCAELLHGPESCSKELQTETVLKIWECGREKILNIQKLHPQLLAKRVRAGTNWQNT